MTGDPFLKVIQPVMAKNIAKPAFKCLYLVSAFSGHEVPLLYLFSGHEAALGLNRLLKSEDFLEEGAKGPHLCLDDTCPDGDGYAIVIDDERVGGGSTLPNSLVLFGIAFYVFNLKV